MKILIRDRAEQDLIQGFLFYEEQHAGIGDYFPNSLASDIDSLRLYAGIHSTHFARCHRLLSKRFPFAVYYSLSEDTAGCTRSSTADVTQLGSANDCKSSDASAPIRSRSNAK